MEIGRVLAERFRIRPEQVGSVIRLLDEGNTIPFIARYRKEATGGLDDQLLRELGDALNALRKLEKRREEIRSALAEQGVLTLELASLLDGAESQAKLEDLWLPYRKKRRTRAQIAREQGLEPLAEWILAQYPKGDPHARAQRYIDSGNGVKDAEQALQGAVDLIAERVSEDAALRGALRSRMLAQGELQTRAAKDEESVYSMYYDRAERTDRIPPHRILAIDRGEREGFLKVMIRLEEEPVRSLILRRFIRGEGECTDLVRRACEDAWRRLLRPSLESDVRAVLTERANVRSIRVFSDDLYQLLMQPPLKGRVTLGVDPGYRTGCKLAVVDGAGSVLETGVAYFTIPGQEQRMRQAAEMIRRMIRDHGVTAIAIGNGTASRESEAFIAELLREMPGVGYAIVNEAGASVYSAGKGAAREFPEYDVTLRSAISIARRLQDPLAELVKIDPKSIGVGQYQHDLKQSELTKALDGVVERCVNSVGVELSTASAELLSHVAGIGPKMAESIVSRRERNGVRTREDLKRVPMLGPKTFEQCAGFIRIADSAEPLDATAIHPERYCEVRKLLALLGYGGSDLKTGGIPGICEKAEEYGTARLADELRIGIPTLTDILSELRKPGRDPRGDLPPAVLRRDVLSLRDLRPGMELSGTVRNIADFGVFVDIGVHRDGLVHISRIADRFIRDPAEVVRVGDIVKVWVVDVDEKRERITLSMVKGKE